MDDSNTLVHDQLRRSDTTMISIDCRNIFTSPAAQVVAEAVGCKTVLYPSPEASTSRVRYSDLIRI